MAGNGVGAQRHEAVLTVEACVVGVCVDGDEATAGYVVEGEIRLDKVENESLERKAFSRPVDTETADFYGGIAFKLLFVGRRLSARGLELAQDIEI